MPIVFQSYPWSTKLTFRLVKVERLDDEAEDDATTVLLRGFAL